jgi:aspartate carbamoyltransferase catalytic subunit
MYKHPAKPVLDVYTLKREFDRTSGLRVAMVGDLSKGRTVRSLSYLLSKFPDNHLTFVSPNHLRMGADIKAHLNEANTPFIESDDLEEVLPEIDAIYMTRVQKERMSPEEYAAAKGKFVINERNLKLIRPDARLMHPLPKIEEVQLPVQVGKTDKRVVYYEQAGNGVYVRAALLHHLLVED